MREAQTCARAGKVKPLTGEELSKAFEELKRKAGDTPPIARIECCSGFYAYLLGSVLKRVIGEKTGVIGERIPSALLGISIVEMKDQKEPYKIIRKKGVE